MQLDDDVGKVAAAVPLLVCIPPPNLACYVVCVLSDVKDEKASLTVNSSCRGAVSAEGVDRNGRVCRPKRSKNNDS